MAMPAPSIQRLFGIRRPSAPELKDFIPKSAQTNWLKGSSYRDSLKQNRHATSIPWSPRPLPNATYFSSSRWYYKLFVSVFASTYRIKGHHLKPVWKVMHKGTLNATHLPLCFSTITAIAVAEFKEPPKTRTYFIR
jgi:hypothetical protein